MKFAMFYEIPVPRPWDEESEHRAYKAVIEEAVLGEKMGFDSFWTVEHHFLEEYSHCSNPEVLYGAVAATTENLRIGYRVRLMPAPYNHPVCSTGCRAGVSTWPPVAARRAPSSKVSGSTRRRRARCGARPSVTSRVAG